MKYSLTLKKHFDGDEKSYKQYTKMVDWFILHYELTFGFAPSLSFLARPFEREVLDYIAETTQNGEAVTLKAMREYFKDEMFQSN